MVKLEAVIKCATCGQVIVFEINVPTAGSKSFSFVCPDGHDATNAQGGCEIVDLKDYDKAQLKRVLL